MTVSLSDLEASSIWEVDNRFGLSTFTSSDSLLSACVIVQVSGSNVILALPYGAIDPTELRAAETEQYLNTALGPHTAIQVRLKGANGRALNKKTDVLLVEVSGRMAS